MTPNNPAPRPCTLWGSTFEANHVTSYGVRAIDDFDVIPASRMFQARITIGSEKWIYSPNQHESRFDAHRDMQEAVNLVNQALHPPLCMKHALEIGYEFRPNQLYAVYIPEWSLTVIAKCELLHDNCFAFADLNGSCDIVATDASSFYPLKIVNGLPYPTHGDAEAVVNAWKEGE